MTKKKFIEVQKKNIKEHQGYIALAERLNKHSLYLFSTKEWTHKGVVPLDLIGTPVSFNKDSVVVIYYSSSVELYKGNRTNDRNIKHTIKLKDLHSCIPISKKDLPLFSHHEIKTELYEKLL
jgi:hypothetical protein